VVGTVIGHTVIWEVGQISLLAVCFMSENKTTITSAVYDE